MSDDADDRRVVREARNRTAAAAADGDCGVAVGESAAPLADHRQVNVEDVAKRFAVLVRHLSLRGDAARDAPILAEGLDAHRRRERVDARALGDDEGDAVLAGHRLAVRVDGRPVGTASQDEVGLRRERRRWRERARAWQARPVRFRGANWRALLSHSSVLS
ncbi:hypothetical protein [Haladaptatus halobius]|uniref:hypothetical protein n=1 Tax=Haladaptatus halobius TaxID=2884875 RepID=UPI001D0B73C8|nr:hypothetical protein [Haladaptatus halobius]